LFRSLDGKLEPVWGRKYGEYGAELALVHKNPHRDNFATSNFTEKARHFCVGPKAIAVHGERRRLCFRPSERQKMNPNNTIESSTPVTAHTDSRVPIEVVYRPRKGLLRLSIANFLLILVTLSIYRFTHPGTRERIAKIKPLVSGPPKKVIDDVPWAALKSICI
jgi:hypothetical protein